MLFRSCRRISHAVAGDAAEMRRHLERSVQLATETGQPAARCQALARLAVHASRLGAERGDDELLEVAEAAGREAVEIAPNLPGHPPWGAESQAALATVALARGRAEEAVERARSAMASLEAAMHDDLYLDVVLPVASTFLATDAPEWEGVRPYLQLMLAMIAQRTIDEDVRVRWLRGPLGRELTKLAGPIASVPTASGAGGDGAPADAADTALLQSLVQGKTNREIAEELGIDEQAVTRRLGELFARIGASSRAEATAFAFHERVL